MAKTILLAEDSVTVQKVIQMTFAAEDFTIIVAESGEDAIKVALETPPDIVIADLSLEGEDGYDICSSLKSIDQVANVPILLLHGSASQYSEGRAREVGADGEIAKPFESQTLIDRVKILCGVPVSAPVLRPQPARPAAPASAASGEISIDASSLGEAPSPKASRPTVKQGPPPLPPPRKKKGPPPPPPRRATSPGHAAEAPGGISSPSQAAEATGAAAPPDIAEPEIVIEAEPPDSSGGDEPLPSFDNPDIPAAPARPPAITIRGFIGTDLPPPPDGMPLPPAGAPVAAPLPAPAPLVAGPPQMDEATRELVLKVSREVIERVVWEVVPDLAERIIREELDRLVEGKVE